MLINQRVTTAAAALALAVSFAAPASAADYVFGSWTPAREYQNAKVMPGVLDLIEKETKGAVKWKLVPGGQLADGKGTFAAVRDGLMQAGLGISPYLPSALPSVNVLYNTVLLGDDVVAGSAAALEVMTLHCPSCQEEARKNNSVLLAGWITAPYHLLCREPVKNLADLKGKRVRATGGNAEMMRLGGATPIAGTLTDALNLLQRGGLDCMFGVDDWLRTFGYADFAKYVTNYPLGMTGPAVGFLMNRDAWNKLTPEQRKVHLKAAAKLSAEMPIGSFIVSNEASLKWAMEKKGVKLVDADAKDFEKLTSDYKKAERDRIVAQHKAFGVKDPGAIMDAYAKAFEKWKTMSKDIGRDPKKLADAIMREIYSKVDVNTY